jgi:hypothetical protein
VSAVIQMPPMAAPVDQLWHVLLDLAERLTVPWTLVGGQMVLLHALERGQVPPQISQDGDLIADIRSDSTAITQVVTELESLGFELAGISIDGLAHRYTRRAHPKPVVVDVLAPEGLGIRSDLTTSPPGRTIEVPGGTQALNRTYRDLALLCALVEDPFDLAEQMTRKDRQRLRRAAALVEDAHPAWLLIPDDIRPQGQIAFGVLTN